jgi:hypothetical protein
VLVDDRSGPDTTTPRPAAGSDRTEADPDVGRVLDCLYGDDADERSERPPRSPIADSWVPRGGRDEPGERRELVAGELTYSGVRSE